MFTGIIEELGEVKSINRSLHIALITIKAKKIIEHTKIGDSIAVNGACLTVRSLSCETLDFEAIPETLKITNLGILRIKDKVNLERALKVGDRLSGHFVTGHIDCMGLIRRKQYINKNLCFQIAFPSKFLKYVLPKGSIAIDGVSLTIAEKLPFGLSVYIIPHTLKNTTLGFKRPSDRVNIEFDILAKRMELTPL